MKILSEYHPETKEFTAKTKATPNPKKSGKYRARANATEKDAPIVGKGFVAVFSEAINEWEIRQDWRGTTYYVRNGAGTIEAGTIDQIGDRVPDNSYRNADDVPKTDAEILAIAESRRAALLAATDNEAMKAFKTGQPLPQGILDFDIAVRALKNLPDWPNIPEENWPEIPA